MTYKVQIEGWKEVRKAIKGLDPEVKKEFAQNMKHVAKIVADEASSRVPSKTGAAAGDIRPYGTTTGPAVRAGKGVEYYKWLDFGSRTPRSGNTRKEGPWRGSGAGPKGGRFIYPAIEDKQVQIANAALDAIEQAAKSQGFK